MRLKDLLKGRSGGLVPIKKLGPGVAKKAASNKALALPKTPKKVKSVADLVGTPEVEAVKTFTDLDFQAVSAAKYQQAEKAGKKLTGFEQVRANIYKDQTDQQLAKRLGRSDLVESYIAKQKPYKGSIYRGVNLDTNDELQELWDSMQKRGTLSIESWTESKELGVKFAGKGKARVMFELVENKKGVSIKNISNKPKEVEVLMPSGVRFKPIDMRVTDDGLRIIRVEQVSATPKAKLAAKPSEWSKKIHLPEQSWKSC